MHKKEALLHYIIKNTIRMLALIPRKLMDGFAVPLGMLWYRIDHNHRKLAFDNMSGAFKDEMDRVEIQNMVKANFIQLARAALGVPSLLKLSKDNLDSYVRFSGGRHLKDALSKGKGVLFLSAHTGNWELMALATPLKFDFKCNLLVRPLDYSPIDRILAEIRCRLGNGVLDKIRSAATISKVLREKEALAIMLDQNASWYDGVYIPFFGRIACTNKGFALFALRYNHTVIPIFNIRQNDGRYSIIISPPVSLVRSGDIGRDVVENTMVFNKIIEKHIRMAPDNWLWVHRRWRLKEIPERAKNRLRVFPYTDHSL